MKPYRLVVMAGLLSMVLLRMPIACATTDHTGGTCDRTEDCYGMMNRQPTGSICKESGTCECPFGQIVCCDSAFLVGYCATACPADCLHPDAGADSGVMCAADSDCNEVAPSPECGRGRCVDGACKLVIEEGPLPSQLRGDCRRRECDITGHIVTVDDPSDWYNDGKECTHDYCLFNLSTKLSEPVNEPAWDGFGCPETGAGVCFAGKCVECLDGIGEVCGNGFACDSFYCVPVLCTQKENGMVDPPLETGIDCGGSCRPCFNPQGCIEAADCVDGVCSGGMCALPTHGDGVQNDNETGVDCGCLNCAPCPDDFGCEIGDNCKSGVCWGGKCQAPACNDGRQNGDEVGIDCGAACNNTCP